MPVPHSVLITGTSSGIGQALAQHYLTLGSMVYGVSRKSEESLNQSAHFHWIPCDLEDSAGIESAIQNAKLPSLFNVVILNAGQLGRIQRMVEAEEEELKRLMQVHVWANQALLKTLFLREIVLHQVVGISSGAAVNGNAGWSGYSISKAAFNMWLSLFAQDYPETHFTALAPGLVDTQMQDYLCEAVNTELYPSVGRLKSARGTEAMPTPEELAPQLVELLPKLLSFNSGSFQDIRKI